MITKAHLSVGKKACRCCRQQPFRFPIVLIFINEAACVLNSNTEVIIPRIKKVTSIYL